MISTIANDDAKSVNVTEDNGGGEMRVWTCRDAEQAEKMLPTFKGRISKGDESAIKDAANEFRKQRDS